MAIEHKSEDGTPIGVGSPVVLTEGPRTFPATVVAFFSPAVGAGDVLIRMDGPEGHERRVSLRSVGVARYVNGRRDS